MKIVINKRFVDRNLTFGRVLKSELTIDLALKKLEYCRMFIPFDIANPTIDDKIDYKIEGLLNVSDSKLNFLSELLNKIKDNNIGHGIHIEKNNVLEYLKYIDLNIDGQNYAININSIEYEMLIHLSTFEIFDCNDIEYIKKYNFPFENKNM